jgi:hypothetical protein
MWRDRDMATNVYQKLMQVQSKLKAPKGQYNSFGKYRYRSCEDILTAVKPLLAEVGAVIVIEDGLEMVGNRIYIKATASFMDVEEGMVITNTAYAREEEAKKGMDSSQITGTASSYARKYALNGLLLIDDTKDADTDENRNERDNRYADQNRDPAIDRTGQPAYPTREEMLAVVSKHYPEGKMRDALLSAVQAQSLETMSDGALKAAYNKAVSKKK